MDTATFKTVYCKGFYAPVYGSFISSFQENFDDEGLTLTVVQEATGEGVEPEHVYIADVVDQKGDRLRIGFYANNGWSHLDALDPDDTLETFADAWYSNCGKETPLVLLGLLDLPNDDEDGEDD